MMISLRGAEMEKKVNYIPAVRSFRQKKVGIYCRVSTNVVTDDDGTHRSNKKYSSKRKIT
jgi:hypothetical protein